MKFLIFAFVAVQAVLQVPALPVITGSSQIIAPSNSVAYNLADTLNLLTVSSLLAGALPYQPVAKIPLFAPPCAFGAPACALSANTCALNAPACALSAPACALSTPACALSAPACALSAPVSNGCGCGCGSTSNCGSYYY